MMLSFGWAVSCWAFDRSHRMRLTRIGLVCCGTGSEVARYP